MSALEATLRGVRIHTALLLERRLGLFLAVDAVILLWALWGGLVEGGRPEQLFAALTTLPCLVVGVPALAHLVAVERQAGTLDLALSTASVERYFLRRVAGVAGFLALQGSAAALVLARGLALPAALAQALGLVAATVAVTAFWGLRLRSTGAVLVAAWSSLLLARAWLDGRAFAVASGRAADVVPWLAETAALWGGVILLAFDARERLRHPQRLV